MAVLPQALEFDQTYNKLLAQQAQENRELQRQQQLLQAKDDQIRAEAFGGAQKQLFDIANAKNLPTDVQKMILDNGLADLTKMYRDPRYRSVDMGVHASGTLKKAIEFSSAFGNYQANGDKFIADLKEKGFDEVNLKSALANSMFAENQVQTPTGPKMVRAPKDPQALGDPIQYLAKQVDDNPQQFINRKAGDERLTKYVGDFKPGEFKYAATKDLTGTRTLKVAYTTKAYPWTEEKEYVDPVNNQKVKYNVLSTEPLVGDDGKPSIDKDGQEIQILSTKAFDVFKQAKDPLLSAQLDVMGRDAIDDHNRAIIGNPQVITRENFDALHQQYPDLRNPFDAGNREIFSRLALSKKLMPQFGKTGEITVTNDQAKPVNVSVSSDLYTKGGSIKPEAKFPTAWAQMVNQDADVMRISENSSFTYDGKTITGRRAGDRAQGQILKDNGKRATVIVRPEEPGSIYVVEIDEDGDLTDNVEKLSGDKAIDYGARISTANGSDPKTFGKLYPSAIKSVVPMSDADKKNYSVDINKTAQINAGKALVASSSTFLNMKENETRNFDNARVKLNGKEVVIKSVTRKDANWVTDSPIEVVTADGQVITFKNKNEFKDELDKNK